MSDKQHLILEQGPHLLSRANYKTIIWEVALALVPALVIAIYNFGMSALWAVIYTVLAAMACEALCCFIRRKPLTLGDGSAFLTGLLLAFSMPVNAPWWLYIVGGAFAIIIAKQVFGGLGHNPFNPAAIARVFLLVSFPVPMTSWVIANSPDMVTGASPLGILHTNGPKAVADLNLLDLFSGYPSMGCIGEISEIALLIGGIYLLIRRIITWHIPVFYIATVAVFAAITHAVNPDQYAGVLFHLSTGAVFLGAFFMATDYVTSPVSGLGKAIFGIGCGIITMVIRLWGAYPEGVSFAIVLMNAFTPLIDRYTKPRVYGCKATGLRRIFPCKH